MREDIKKKFMDILFETEDDEPETVVEGKLEDVKPVSTIKASDILYAKPKKETAFINLEEEPAKTETIVTTFNKKDDEYIIKPNLSPMFGLVDEEPEKTSEVNFSYNEPAVEEAKPKKVHSSYLGTIISPIYGYDVKSDFSNTLDLSINKLEEAQRELDAVENEVFEKKPVEEEYVVEEEPVIEEEPAIVSRTIEGDALLGTVNDIFEGDDFYEEIADEIDEVVEEVEDEEPVEEENKAPELRYDDFSFGQFDHQYNTAEIDLFEDLFKEDEE